MISHNANQNKCSIMKQQIVTSHAKLTFNKTKWNHQKEKHTQLDNFHNPTNRATTRYSYMRRTLHKKKPPPYPPFESQISVPESRTSNPQLKTRGSTNKRMWTDTGPPEPFHPFTTNCDLTGYARNIFFFTDHKVHFVDGSRNLGETRRFTQPQRNSSRHLLIHGVIMLTPSFS